jgi:hypothetical protein
VKALENSNNMSSGFIMMRWLFYFYSLLLAPLLYNSITTSLIPNIVIKYLVAIGYPKRLDLQKILTLQILKTLYSAFLISFLC